MQETLDKDNLFDFKMLEKQRGFLVYVTRTYPALTPFILQLTVGGPIETLMGGSYQENSQPTLRTRSLKPMTCTRTKYKGSPNSSQIVVITLLCRTTPA